MDRYDTEGKIEDIYIFSQYLMTMKGHRSVHSSYIITFSLNDCISSYFSYTSKETPSLGELTGIEIKELMSVMDDNKTWTKHKNGSDELLEKEMECCQWVVNGQRLWEVS